MSAANVSGIPHSFVVDSAGIVKFQGHPADPNFEKAVAQVCCGPSRPPKPVNPAVAARKSMHCLRAPNTAADSGGVPRCLALTTKGCAGLCCNVLQVVRHVLALPTAYVSADVVGAMPLDSASRVEAFDPVTLELQSWQSPCYVPMLYP